METITFNNLKIMTLYNSLTEIYLNQEIKFPIKFAYLLYKNIQSIENIVTSIQNVYRTNFENKDINEFDEEQLKAYNEFCDIENELQIETCSIEELGNINLSLRDYQAISFMIK